LAKLKSHVLKFGRPGPKGRKMVAIKVSDVVGDTMKSHFFVTGQIDMKFGQKTSVDVLY